MKSLSCVGRWGVLKENKKVLQISPPKCVLQIGESNMLLWFTRLMPKWLLFIFLVCLTALLFQVAP